MKRNRPRILVVDDNPADVEVLRFCLDLVGEEYDLTVLHDGEAALQYIRDDRSTRTEPLPCVLVLDLHLPKRSGIEILHELRQEPSFADVTVVVVTSVFQQEESARVRRLGAHYRVKPSDLRASEELAAFVLEQCRSGAAAA